MQIMTDIELFGDGRGKVIFQLSAVAFDMDGRISDPHELIQPDDMWFDAVVVGEAGRFPLPVAPSTIAWWAEEAQSPAREILLRAAQDRPVVLADALLQFFRFCNLRLRKTGGHWANSPSFDLVLIRKLYESIGQPAPWHFRQERDMRTLMVLIKKLGLTKLPNMKTVGLVPHVGLHDAARQAVLVQAAYRVLGLNAGDHARAARSTA